MYLATGCARLARRQIGVLHRVIVGVAIPQRFPDVNSVSIPTTVASMSSFEAFRIWSLLGTSVEKEFLRRNLQDREAEVHQLKAEMSDLRKQYDEKLLNIYASREVQLEQKNNHVEQLHVEHQATLTNLHERLAAAREDKIKARLELQAANDKILGLTNKRNMRGALELAASKHASGGTQKVLTSLQIVTDFEDIVKDTCSRHNLKISEVTKCLENLYHSFSKDMHGSEEVLYLRWADVPAPNERAALAAVLEFSNIKYTCIDMDGKIVDPSPYARR